MGNKAELLRRLGNAIERSIYGGVLHDAGCPAEGRYKELEISMTIGGGGDVPLPGAVPVRGYMECHDCGARGFPSFRTAVDVETGERRRVERIFRREK